MYSEPLLSKDLNMSGADGGAIVNTLLIDHFQSMARDHFIVLRLEKKYGHDVIKHAYVAL